MANKQLQVKRTYKSLWRPSEKEEGVGLEVQVRFGREGRRGAGQSQVHKKRRDTQPKQRVCVRQL